MWRKAFQAEEIASAKCLRLEHNWYGPISIVHCGWEHGEQGFQKVVEDEVRKIRKVVNHRGSDKSFVLPF